MLKKILIALAVFFISLGTYFAKAEDKISITAPIKVNKDGSTEKIYSDVMGAEAAQLGTTPPAADVGVRAGDVFVSCKDYFQNKFNNKENVSKRATCNGYFMGVASTLLTLQQAGINTEICLPKDISTHQVIKIFIDWGNENEKSLTIPATDATLKALSDKYPCI
jgi:hypothetical protein